MHGRATLFALSSLFLGFGGFVACSGNSGQPITDAGGKDVAAQPDTSVVDAGVDAPLDAPPTDAPGFVWPDCTSQPNGVPTKTIADLWNDDPSAPTQVWIPGVYVTAVSGGSCKAGTACDFFLQQDLSYASLAEAAHHGIRGWVTTNTSKYFTSLAVDQQVNVLAWAYRDTSQGQNELILHVDLVDPGCALAVGNGTAMPVTATLADLDQVVDYEQTYGPVLVTISDVTGTPAAPNQTFGLGNTFFDGGSNGGQIISLSPFYLPNGVFTNLTQSVKTKFTSVTGVYGIFTPPTDASVTKYLEIYPRTTADIITQ
jgi:hypothetical protein